MIIFSLTGCFMSAICIYMVMTKPMLTNTYSSSGSNVTVSPQDPENTFDCSFIESPIPSTADPPTPPASSRGSRYSAETPETPPVGWRPHGEPHETAPLVLSCCCCCFIGSPFYRPSGGRSYLRSSRKNVFTRLF